IRIALNPDLIKDRPTFVSTDWRHPWEKCAKNPVELARVKQRQGEEVCQEFYSKEEVCQEPC
ncbi:hypothetical protein Tco_0501314, partial [Tanacetum coccineum]